MHLKSTLGLMALSVGLVAAAPAGAQPGHHHGDQAGRGGGDVPTRVAKRIKRAERALDRASGYADDGNEASATSALGAVNKNLAAASTTASRARDGCGTAAIRAARAAEVRASVSR